MVIQDTFSELWLTFDPHWLIAATCLYANVGKIVTPFFFDSWKDVTASSC